VVISRDGGLRKWAKVKRGGILREGAMRDGGLRIGNRAACAKEDNAAWILKAIGFICFNLIVRLNL
jgi:hypothetical protein